MKLRKSLNGTKSNTYALTVPQEIGDMIPEEMQFSATLTEHGILFRPLLEAVPEWAGATATSDTDADL